MRLLCNSAAPSAETFGATTVAAGQSLVVVTNPPAGRRCPPAETSRVTRRSSRATGGLNRSTSSNAPGTLTPTS